MNPKPLPQVREKEADLDSLIGPIEEMYLPVPV